MQKFVVEREIPSAGRMDAETLRSAPCRRMEPRISWEQSYVADDKLFCGVMADSENDIREHRGLGGIPVDRISRVQRVIGPAAVRLSVRFF